MNILYKGFASGDNSKAVLAFSKGNYRDAKTLWMKVLEKNPDNTTALKGTAFCLFMEEHDRDASEYLEEAAGSAMTDPEIPNLLALINLRRGRVENAIEILLDALERNKDPLLKRTLEKIRQLKNPDHAKNISVLPLAQITLPAPRISLNIIKEKIGMHIIWIVALGTIGLLVLFYPSLRNASFLIRRGNISPATQVSIKDIDNIINARENFRIILDEKIIIKKFEELKQAISDQKHNRARMLVNEILASNASLAVKERVSILESFIVEATTDNIDYVPSYTEIAVAPVVYEGVILRWQGTIANIHHQGRKKTSFDLLVNFLGAGIVEGIAAVEADGFHEIKNGKKITVIGPLLGITTDNRIIIKAEKLIPIS